MTIKILRSRTFPACSHIRLKTKDLVINAGYCFSLIVTSYFLSDFRSCNTIRPTKTSDFLPSLNSTNQKLNLNRKSGYSYQSLKNPCRLIIRKTFSRAIFTLQRQIIWSIWMYKVFEILQLNCKWKYNIYDILHSCREKVSLGTYLGSKILLNHDGSLLRNLIITSLLIC